MFLSVLTKNLTRNLVTFILLWGLTEKSDFLGEVHELKVVGGGGDGGLDSFQI